MSAEAQPFVSKATSFTDMHTRLRGRPLLLARVSWFAVVGLTVALYVLSIPIQIAQSQTLCNNADVNQCFQAGQLTAELVHELQQIGLSLNFYVAFFTVVQVIFALIFLAVGALIFWRKSDDSMALRVSLMLVIFGLTQFSDISSLAPVYPALRLPSLLLQFLGVALLILFFFQFPDGRFVPRWTRWLVPLILIREGINTFLSDSALGRGNIGAVLVLVEVTIALFAQIYRYRRASGPVQRQQTKWVVYSVAVALIGYFGLIFGGMLFISRPSVLTVMIIDTLLPIFLLLIPLSILIAILRFRLYEIDILINRTLVYVPLTAILAGIFAASITLSQKLFIAITGQSSDAATVFTTLVVVAAFEPLKTGLQHLVDRRFKEPHNPTKELQAMRDQANALLQVIDEESSARHLLDVAVRAFEAIGGAVLVQQNGQARVVYTSGEWNGDARLRVPLEGNGTHFGELALGARRNGADYSEPDRAALQEAIAPVARVIALTRQLNGAR